MGPSTVLHLAIHSYTTAEITLALTYYPLDLLVIITTNARLDSATPLRPIPQTLQIPRTPLTLHQAFVNYSQRTHSAHTTQNVKVATVLTLP